MTKKGTFPEFLDELCKDLGKHGTHKFHTAWQERQFDDSVNGLQKHDVVLIMDFAENYTCRKQCESQSYHWCQKQITIHPMMAYYYDSDDDGDNVKDLMIQKEAIVMITDDNKHDAHAVSVFENITLDHLRKKINITHVHEWTDGCPGQYKGKHALAGISMFPDRHQIPVTRNIFGGGHGKNPCDGGRWYSEE